MTSTTLCTALCFLLAESLSSQTVSGSKPIDLGAAAPAISARYLAAVESASVAGASRATWQERLDRERDTIENVLQWNDSHQHAAESLRMLVVLSRFWNGPSVVDDFATALAAPSSDSSVRVRALDRASIKAFQLGDQSRTRQWARESVTLALALHDSTAAGVAYERLVQAALRDGNHTALASLADTGQRLCVHDANCQVYFLNMRGESARVRQRYDSAAMYYAAADSVSRLSSPRFRTDIAHNLGFTLLALGRVSEARARFREALQHALADRDRVNTAFLVAGCASAEAVDHRAASAGSLFGLYDSILEQTGRIADPADVVEYDRYRSRAREQLGQSAFDETVRIGRRMNADSALASLLGARR